MTLSSNDNDDKYQIFVSAILQLSMAKTIGHVGEIVRSVARQLTGAHGATFVLRERDQCYYADEDEIAPLWKGKRFPMHSCISGWVMQNQTAAVIPDIYHDSRIPVDAYQPTFVKSLAMVPIRKDDPLGAIGNYWSSENMPDERTVQVLQALADITAVSIGSINVYNELDKRVSERTRQLQELNAQLEKTNSELETITYALSHDLKVPLRTIKINIERMIDDLGDDVNRKAKVYTDKILSKVNSSRKLIDELLTLFQTHNKKLDLREVDMEKMAHQVAAESIELVSRNTSIKIDKLPPIVADKALLRRVWSNLISNAVKYSTRNQECKINIGFQELEHSIVYCIEDNGVGFDITKAGDLFKPFTRFHSTAEFEGAGIGLSIVERVVSLHGGKVWARSAIGRGTTVFFELSK